MNSAMGGGCPQVHTPHRRVILGYGQFRKSDARSAGGSRLQRPLRVCLLSPSRFCSTSSGIAKQRRSGSGNVHSADDWQELLEPVVKGYRKKGLRLLFRGDAASWQARRYTSIWNKRRLGTQSGFQLTRYFREKSRTCWYGLLSGLPKSPSSHITTSITGPRVGMSWAEEWWPRYPGVAPARTHRFPE